MREDVQKISVAKTEHEEGGRRGRMGTVRRRRVYTKKNRTEEKGRGVHAGTQDGRRFKDGKNGCKRRRVVALACLLPAFVLYKM